MSTSLKHYPKSIPYPSSYQPTKFPISRKNSGFQTTHQYQDDLVEIPEDSQDASESIGNEPYYEDDPETDNSIDDEEQYEDMKGEESSSELESRQLSYVSIPSSILSDSGNNLVPGDQRKSYSVSPAHSYDSVVMDLESDGENQDIQEPSEEVDDESSQQDQDFVNVRVKVQKERYAIFDDSVKVTVSLEPTLELDEFQEIADYSNESEISESEAGSEIESSEYSDNEEVSESINNDSEEGGESGNSDSGESNAEPETDDEASRISEEQQILKSGISDHSQNKGSKIVRSPQIHRKSMRVKTLEDNGKYSAEIDLLNKAIKAGGVKITTDIARSFISSLTPMPTPNHSPDISPQMQPKIRSKNKASLSTMKLVQSNLPTERTLTQSSGVKLIGEANNCLKSLPSEISKSLPQIPKSQPISPKIAKSQPVSPKAQSAMPKPQSIISVAPKSEGGNLGTSSEISTSMHEILSTGTKGSSSIQTSLPSAATVTSILSCQEEHILDPPSTSHKDNSVETKSRNDQKKAFENEAAMNQPPEPDSTSTQKLQEGHSSAPKGPSLTLVAEDQKVDETLQDDHLSMYANSVETSDDEDDENTMLKQTKRQTQEEQEEVKAAKDKLVELWKVTTVEDTSDLDDAFSTILDDMLSELKQGPVPVQLPLQSDIKTLDEIEKVKEELPNPEKQLEEQPDQSDEAEVEEREPNKESENTQDSEERKSDADKQEKTDVDKQETSDVDKQQKSDADKQEKWNADKQEIVDTDKREKWNTDKQEIVDADPDEFLTKAIRKWNNSTEIASALSQYLLQIKTETVESNVTEIIPLLTQLLLGSRKANSEHDLPTLIAAMSAVRVLCDRFMDVRAASGDKGLKNVDLSWLIRILCKISSDTSSKVKPEAAFSLARLVKAGGPELITRPIYFLLVMENEGYGHTKGAQGAKTKAAALDTLTYALMTYPKEEFDDLEEIARWVCLALYHSQRRVRHSALECLSVIGEHLGGPTAAISIFRGLIVREKDFDWSRSGSDSDGGFPSKEKEKVPGMAGYRASTGMGIFDVSAITAFSTRLKKQILPLPSSNGLIDYGVKVPTGKDLILILTKLQEVEDDEFDVSSSAESFISAMSNSEVSVVDQDSEADSIRMSDLERAGKDEQNAGLGNNMKTKKSEILVQKEKDIITADVAYILSGKGRIKQDFVVAEENLKQMNELISQEQDNLLKGDTEDVPENNDNKEETEKALEKKKKRKKRKRAEMDKKKSVNQLTVNDKALQEAFIGLPAAKLIDLS